MAIKVCGEALSTVEAMGLGMSESNTPKNQSQAGKKPGNNRGVGRSDKNDWAIAQEAVAKIGKPLAFQSGEFWLFDPTQGWVNASQQVFGICAQLKKRNPAFSVLPIIENQVRIPKDHTVETLYWERTGDAWNPKWQPVSLKSTELLFTDQIYNCLTGETEWLNGRVIYGPMISLPWSYNDEADADPRCAEFEALVAHALPDPEVYRHFQECMGTILQPHETLRGQIVMWGVPYSGKTTIATAIGCCPGGRRGLSQAQEEELVRDKYMTSALVNRFANVSDDSAITSRWVSFLKRYTSGSMVVEAKYHMPETVTPPAKLISTCNQVQSLVDSSGAGVDRMLSFKFERALPKVSGTGNDKKMTALYWSDPARRAGILSWLMEGLIRLRERGRFDPPKVWLEQLNEAAGKADHIAETLSEALVKDETGFVSVQELVALFDGDTGIGIKSLVNRLPDYMTRLFGANRTKKYIDGKQVRGYNGVKMQEA